MAANPLRGNSLLRSVRNKYCKIQNITEEKKQAMPTRIPPYLEAWYILIKTLIEITSILGDCFTMLGYSRSVTNAK